jgi:hypothetical protein
MGERLRGRRNEQTRQGGIDGRGYNKLALMGPNPGLLNPVAPPEQWIAPNSAYLLAISARSVRTLHALPDRLRKGRLERLGTVVLGASCPDDSSLRHLNSRILFGIFVATVAVVNDDASIEVDIVANNSGPLSRLAGFILAPVVVPWQTVCYRSLRAGRPKQNR